MVKIARMWCCRCSACRVLHIHVGLYAVHLERWLSLFKPDQLLIWVSAFALWCVQYVAC
jgi:hypothetical protein